MRVSQVQATAWQRAASAAGHASAGTWIAEAVDCHLRERARAGKSLPLSWRKGRFKVLLEDGEATVRGFTSEPFHAFRGSFEGPAPNGDHYSLVYERRIVATLKTYGQVRVLASELAPVFARGDPPLDPGGIIERHRREAK